MFFFPFVAGVVYFARSLPACGRVRRALDLLPPLRGKTVGKEWFKRNLQALRAMSLSSLTMSNSDAPTRLNNCKQP
jgi:hypothetical protein